MLGVGYCVGGALGILLACFIGWAVATGEAGRMMYHDGHAPPMTLMDEVQMAVIFAVLSPPFGLLWGLLLCIYGVVRMRRSLSRGVVEPAV